MMMTCRLGLLHSQIHFFSASLYQLKSRIKKELIECPDKHFLWTTTRLYPLPIYLAARLIRKDKTARDK